MNRTLLSAAVALGLTAGVVAQDATVPLDISVRDIYARNLEGARVEITNARTGARLVTATGPDGRAWLPVHPGTYRIAVSLAGYGSLVASNFCVVAGAPAKFGATLGPERPGRPAGSPAAPPGDSALVYVPRSEPASGVLSDAEIRDAMAFGRRSRKLSGYKLTASRGFERWQLGHLFTPFLRVATMTQAADATKTPFEVHEIPRPFVERSAWVVAGPSEHREAGVDEDAPVRRYLVPPERIVIRPKSSREEEIRPGWWMRLETECDREVYEKWLGRQFPLRGLVAAFPMEAIAPGNAIVVTYSSTADPPRGISLKIKPVVRRLTIRDKDVQSWR